MILTREQLLKINGGKKEKEVDYYIDALNEIMPKYGIDTPLRIAHFLAQIIYESGYLKDKEENLNYSAERLLQIFPKYFKTKEEAQNYARKPEAIANRVYGNRSDLGNGDEKSGDGWKYRGRGLIQLTGKSNYEKCGQAIGYSLLYDPDLILRKKDVSVTVACWFWISRNLNALADKDDIEAITKKINGGLNGLEDRQKILTRAKDYLIGGRK